MCSREIEEAELGLLYPRMLALAAPASLAGLPQVTLPLAATPRFPIGLSVRCPAFVLFMLRQGSFRVIALIQQLRSLDGSDHRAIGIRSA